MRPPGAATTDAAVFVEAPARLHFGVLDLRGALGRRFGGIGAAAPGPSLLLSATIAPTVSADGPDAARAVEYARRFLAHQGVDGGVHVHVRRTLPAHVGLGSGTQFALATAHAIADLYGLPSDAPSLARAVGRARRSAVGTWIFDAGGLVLEGGRRPGSDDVAPLLARLPFPPSWRCVVAVPDAAPGVSGAAEAAAFATLPIPPERDAERVAHLVLMALLPAVVEADLATFGAALGEVQAITGRWFAPAQGGVYAAGAAASLVQRMRAWGAVGVGQSSWGPTVYGLVADDDEAAALATDMRDAIGAAGAVYAGPFGSGGARVWASAAAGDPPRGSER
ncbi:MAG TPA: beta-ribofuranosylaminobenzene 5'-phosphate synthase family protein [Gemmatirosa sp.]